MPSVLIKVGVCLCVCDQRKLFINIFNLYLFKRQRILHSIVLLRWLLGDLTLTWWVLWALEHFSLDRPTDEHLHLLSFWQSQKLTLHCNWCLLKLESYLGGCCESRWKCFENFYNWKLFYHFVKELFRLYQHSAFTMAFPAVIYQNNRVKIKALIKVVVLR